MHFRKKPWLISPHQNLPQMFQWILMCVCAFNTGNKLVQQLISVQLSQYFNREVQSREQPLLMICNTQRDRASRLSYQNATAYPNEPHFVSVWMYFFICVSLLTDVQHKHMKQPGSVLWRASASTGMLFGIWLLAGAWILKSDTTLLGSFH